MQTDHIKPLKILNASAGSGKTFNLVKEYISLLMKDYPNLNKFSNIIAMTFTNKAALEMKSRIIIALDELSYPGRISGKENPYEKAFINELNITPEEIQKRSRGILQQILHRYEEFYVMTIDKFNLKLIRSFSRDLNLPSEFEVILNETEVIEQVVDLLLDQLGKEPFDEFTQMVMEYAKTNLDDGEKWNFRDQLVEFGSILSKEKDQPLIEKLLLMDLSPKRYRQLKSESNKQLDEFKKRCHIVFELFNRLAIPTASLPKGNHTVNAINKLADIRVFPEVLFSNAFIETASQVPPESKVYPSELRNALLELYTLHSNIVGNYYIQVNFLKNFYKMALLQHMAQSLHSIKKDEQLIRISEFNKLISELVKDEEAPFIYERLGARFQHFLLDEFQDTSRLQWLNMVPLIHDSLGKNMLNLIVGDPKQSIYRFKNGVAEQFVALPEVYNPENEPKITEKSSFFKQMGIVNPLKENWRSAPTIVDFNNRFFTILKENLPYSSRDFYDSIHQIAKASLNGYVEIISEADQKSEKNIVSTMVNFIEACEADGFKRGEICILSDVNSRANEWAIELNKLGYKVVSADSLLIQNEIRVKLIVSYLKRRLNPSSDSEKKRFAELYFRINSEDTFRLFRSYFEKYTDKDGVIKSRFNDERFLKENLGGSPVFFRKYENLYDLIQSFYKLMQWDELSNPYLHHFADFVHEFELTKGPDIQSFLSHYNDQKSKLAIQLPESDDAIKIMTVHKSKGLEFPVVILPFVDFSVNIKTNAKFLLDANNVILYTTVKKESPVDVISSFRNTESDQILTDKVNQLYVGFTRPKERLYVLNYFKKNNFGEIIHSCLKQFDSDNEFIHLQYGERTRDNKQRVTNSSQFFIPVNISENLWFPDIALQDSESLLEKDLLSEEQRYGNQFHLVMASIDHPNDIEDVMQKMILSGEIEHAFENRIRSNAQAIFQLKAFNSLFENCFEILNERSIILDEQTIIRPDKVFLKEHETLVLDFKTGIPKTNDVKQLQSYVSALYKMEFPNVKGYILYTSLKELRLV